MSEKEPEKVETEPTYKVIWKWIVKYQFAGYVIISAVLYFNQDSRQSRLERQVEDARKQAVHQAETAYSVGISGLLQTATILEGNLVEMKQQNLLLIKCVKEKTCDSQPELLQVKEQKQYVPVATHYFNIQKQMIEESKEDR